MPVNQVMTFTATVPTTGETPAVFNANAIGCWNELKLNVVPDLNVAFGEMNVLETNVNAKEVSAVYSASIATAAADYQGEWVSQGYTLGQSVSSGGTTYMCKLTHATGQAVTNTTYWQPTGIASIISGLTSKTTPVDADELALTDSATSFSLKKLTWANLKANIPTGKNYIINGGFDYWNYATSQTASGYGSDDRWNNGNIGSTKTHSMINAADTERALFNSSKFSRTVVTSVAAANNRAVKVQLIENITKLAGKTVTVSFFAKADSNKNIGIELYQAFGTGGTPSAGVGSIGSQLVALTSIWQKKTITITIPSIVGKTLGTDGVHTSSTGLWFWFDAGSDYNSRTASLGQQSGTFDIAEVKLEEGSVSTPWTPYEGEFGGEGQACARYLPIVTNGSGFAYGLAAVQISGSFYPASRVAPTGVTALNLGTATGTVGSVAVNSSLFANGTLNGFMLNIGAATNIVNTVGQAANLYSAKYLLTGCEL